MPNSEIILEVCAGSLEDAVAAEQAGANRIELNAGLPLGGLTPSAGLVREVLAAVQIPVIAMVRPRPGGFCYSDSEWRVLLADAEAMLAAGVRGLAFGVLDAGSNIDVDRCSGLVRRFSGAELVFHRAFDLVPDWHVAVKQLIGAGLTRLMTSGQKETAVDGRSTIREIVNLAGDRIGVLPAAGINRHNALELIQATGASQIHGSFSETVDDPGYPPPGGLRFAANDGRGRANREQIAETVRLLKTGKR